MNLSGAVVCAVLLSFLTSIVICGENGVPRKLRRYKICNGTKCKSIRSFTPPSILLDMDSFLYSRWTRWSPCTRHCTTKRYRACKFPLVCGNTILHEEAFCYHRGSHCQHIFENNQRDFLADAGEDDDLEDYTDQLQLSEEHVLQRVENNPLPTLNSNVMPSVSNRATTPQTGASRQISGRAYPNPLPHPVTTSEPRPLRHQHSRRGRNHETYYRPSDEMFSETVGPFPIASVDYTPPASYHEENNPTCGIARITDGISNGLSLRILGGRESRRGKWPWQVALLNRMEEVFCGGTLIGPRWILTAAHCVRRKLSVTIGEHHLHRNDGTEKHYKVQAAFIHPDFDHETVDNDVALLLLPEPVPTAAGLACLPNEHQPLPLPGTLCTILGWGKRNHTHVFGTTSLHEGKVPIVSNLECRYTYGTHDITSNMFCAGYRKGNVDSCAGDSGGPILCTEENRWTIFGVTSFGDGCGRKNKFGIYAKVSNYVGWIQKIMKANEFFG